MAIITVTNETGCGEVMYTKIAKTLNYKLFNKELMRYVAALSGLNEKDLDKMDEKKHSRVHLVLNSFLDLSLFSSDKTENIKNTPSMPYEYDNSPSGENFKYATEKVIRMIANDGNAVIVGRGSNLMLQGYTNVLNIYICADIKQRAANISKSMGLDEKYAYEYAEQTDAKKIKFIKYYYKTDMTDIHNYHMVLNLSLIDEERAADIICGMVNNNLIE